MALEFDDIFAGRARRSVEAQDQRLVEQLAGRRMAQLAHRGVPRLRQRAGDRVCAASCALGPLTRMTAIAAGGRPLDRAKMVSPPSRLR